MFNEREFWERAQSGEFRESVERRDGISPRLRRKLGMPHGSVSEIVAYRLPDGTKVALVHQYVRPGGTVRGRPDPKYLLVDGEIYAPRPEPPPQSTTEAASTEKD